MSALRTFMCVFVSILMLNTTTATAAISAQGLEEGAIYYSDRIYLQEGNEGEPVPVLYDEEGEPLDLPYDVDFPLEFDCTTTTARDAQRSASYLQDLLGKMGVMQNIGAGTEPNTNRNKLQQDSLLATDPELEKAQKIPIPNEEVDIEEASWLLGKRCYGAFAYGLVADDSMRVGRCEGEAKDSNCHLTGDDMYRRNSGVGIQGVTKNVKEEVGNLWDGAKDLAGWGVEQMGFLEGLLTSENPETMEMETWERPKGKYIENSILAQTFNAKLQGNCQDPSCTISTYSMFDKMFNTWSSAEMVVGNFGPSLLGDARRFFGRFSSRYWPFSLRNSKLADRIFSSKFFQPTSFLGKYRMQHAKSLIDEHKLNDIFTPLYQKHYIIKSGSFDTYYQQKLAGADGLITKLTDPVQQKYALKVAHDFKEYGQATHSIVTRAQNNYKAVLDSFGPDTPQEIAARIEFGKAIGKIGNDMDDTLGLDWPEFFMTHPSTPFRTSAIYNPATGHYHHIAEDTRNMRKVIEKFVDDGHWANMSQAQYEYSVQAGTHNPLALQLYAPVPKTKIGAMNATDLEEAVASGNATIMNQLAEVGTGEYIPISSENLHIIQELSGGNVNIYAHGGWKKSREISPEEFASQLTQSRMIGRISGNIKNNSRRIYETMRDRGFGGRRFSSLLDDMFQRDKHFIKTYTSLKGGVKYTVAPYLYWGARRGAGVEYLSFYQLPDEWHELVFSHKDSGIYDDAYVDFFANEGSDQGDLFVRALNILPWKMGLNTLSEHYAPLKKFFDKYTKGEARDTVEDIAIFVSGPRECPTCEVTINHEGLQDFSPHYIARASTQTYVLERTRSQEAIETGQVLISFAHHTDIHGESKQASVEGDKIDLVEAVKEGKTCRDKLKDLPLGFSLLEVTGDKAGLVLASMESLSYAAFGWSGIMASTLIQLMITSELQDCVDIDEGYYAHYFLASPEEQNQQQDTVELAAGKVDQSIAGFREQWLNTFKATQEDESAFGKAVQSVGDSIEKFVKNSEQDNILQATVSVSGSSEGQMQGKKLFFFWSEGASQLWLSKYKTEGREVITDDLGNEVDVDYEAGTMNINGENVPIDPDILRAAMGQDFSIPAYMIGQRVTKIALPLSSDVVFEADAQGNVIIRDPRVLDCIESGVLAQTGLPFTDEFGNSTTNLADVFGRLEGVSTSTHPAVVTDGEGFIAEGNPRKYANAAGAQLNVHADMEVMLLGANDGYPDLGYFDSMHFQYGTIVANRSKNELIVWLRNHSQGAISDRDIIGMDTDIEKMLNPETGCEEAAIDLEVIGNPDSPRALEAASKFNTSIEHLGPFQAFDTETKRYLFYTTPAPECAQRMKIIDKATGEVLADYAVSNLQSTPTGVAFTDEEGNEHTLDFRADNGVPTVSFDGEPEEVLRSGSGLNGSFHYDPDKGMLYANNAQLIPLLEAFRKDGMYMAPTADGAVTATGGQNIMNLNLGSDSDGSLLNLPSVPEHPLVMLLFVVSLLSVFIATRSRVMRKRLG